MAESIQKKFGKVIRSLREEKSWSQEKLAEEVGVHRTYVGMVERGEKNIALKNIERFARALSVQIKDIFNLV